MKYLIILTLLLIADILAIEPIAPIPTEVKNLDLQKAILGRTLFSDPILSSDRTISCHSCHNFKTGGTDRQALSTGVKKRKGNIQSPTVFNAVFNFKQFWNGRADNLQEQAQGPLTTHAEMNMQPYQLEERLNKSTSYRHAFKKVYHSTPITMKQITGALAEFEKALITPNSRFDRYLRGEIKLSSQEQKGYNTFKSLGCITCHNGINIGANSFQKMGLFRPYKYDKSYPDRYSLTKKEYHKNVFKVPTLRNVSLTAPYFHDASAKTLKDAVEKMAYHNLGIKITKEQVQNLVAFLNSLEGETPHILEIK